MRSIVTVAAFTALIALAPAAAQAATECQSSLAAGSAADAAGAWEAWEDNVASAYGAAWAKLELAQNRNVLPISIPSLSGTFTTYTAYAIPCRKTRIGADMLANVGDFELMQSNEPEIAPTMNFKHAKKLVKFN